MKTFNAVIVMILMYCGVSIYDNTDDLVKSLLFFAVAAVIGVVGWITSNYKIVRK